MESGSYHHGLSLLDPGGTSCCHPAGLERGLAAACNMKLQNMYWGLVIRLVGAHQERADLSLQGDWSCSCITLTLPERLPPAAFNPLHTELSSCS